MRLSDFIDRLLEIQNSSDADDFQVEVMTEGKNIQLQHKVTDIAKSSTSIIIIGNEVGL